MEQELRQNLLSCASAFASAKNVEMTTLGRLAAGDWRFFSRLAEGVTFTAKKYDGVMHWFSQNWPGDAAWPADVPRPEATQSAA